MAVLRTRSLVQMFVCASLLLVVSATIWGMVNAMDEQNREYPTVKMPVMVELPFDIRASILRAWTVVHDDFLRTFDLEENDSQIENYIVSFSEEDGVIVIHAGRPPWAPGSRGLEHSVIYRVRKSDYQFIDKVMLK